MVKTKIVTLQVWTEDATDTDDQEMANIITDNLVDLFAAISSLLMATTKWDPIVMAVKPKNQFARK